MPDESAAPSLSGIWDRFMTPGLKIQYKADIDPETGDVQEVPEEYDFSPETFRQVVQNFSRTFSERRLSMDLGNHVAADPTHTKPVELARYSGLAAVWDGKVIAFWDQFPDLAPPDPPSLLAALQEKFPRATSADGLWGYRREVTPAGESLLPNMHQTSPMFSKEDKDEAGNEIGYAINNVSPVYIAHQNGTVLMSKKITMGQQWNSYEEARSANPGKKIIKVQGGYGSGQASRYELAPETDWFAEQVKRALDSGKSEEDVIKEFQISRPRLRQIQKMSITTMGQPSSAVHAPRPIGEEETMADKPDDKKDPKEGALPAGLSPEMRKMACSKFGMPEGATDGELLAHILGRMGDAPTTMDVDPSNKEQNAAIHLKTGNVHDVASKMSGLPNEEIPGNEAAKPNSQTNFARVAPILEQLGKRVSTTEKDNAELRAELAARREADKKTARATFSKRFREDEGRWDVDDEKGLLAFLDDMAGDIDKASAHIEQYMPPRAAFARKTQGGHPVGTETLKKGSADKAAAFSKRVDEHYAALSKGAANKNHAFAEAQRRAKAELPEEYQAYSTGGRN